jgi:hypothetical protein
MVGGRRPARRLQACALLSLDDRTLADIGLRRAEVAAVVSGQLPPCQLTAHGPMGPGEGRPLPREASPPAQPLAPAHQDAAA